MGFPYVNRKIYHQSRLVQFNADFLLDLADFIRDLADNFYEQDDSSST